MKTLLGTIQVPLAPLQRKQLEFIDSEDLTPIIKHAEKEMRDHGITPTLSREQATYGLSQYYALAAINGNNMHAVSGPIDPYWHSHVLHTVAYARFCEIGIGYFMHHDPLDQDDRKKAEAVNRVYGYTLEVLGKFFGQHVDPVAYPVAQCICFHFNNTKDVGSFYPADPTFADVRAEYAGAVV